MLISEQKPMEEILGSLDGESKVFVVGCNGCAEGCESGGEAQVVAMVASLGEASKTVTGKASIDMICNENLTRMSLHAHKDDILAADSVLVMCCGAGVQAVADAVDMAVHPGCNTKSQGGGHAEWEGAEHCQECGDCVLDYTGGICPISRCSKNLLNGPCGGSVQGKCEVADEMDCAWQLIIDRLTKIGRLDKLEKVIPPKNWSKSLTGGPAVPPKKG